ncbi:ribosomal RNA small subunit methyltransferase B [Dinoroseobacter shibae DFL 12 = DSM 16493]|uniref:Ribosomal RNA small subunit methyltransferase B n=1 Tax=Dinoroseobacter shibae (strain DSM 16493 / NCIMB 14021 / DFL 12) TaxID=398580 RepID=A8LKI3_DINSH|nr:RsmB/NOP family class I SAM-dependent RNA methyltransferase [Dinoroseobacter shibae]ABV94766.1 ribosomal RNA small subunit methyltransferase B [Dinoroseobacter shibae DFL 12 = DSM 16493]URF46186.1 methyltransferase domain-containing protein [Dinoroseobacter shibae]URF50493.1 methyltransferase domain-containing protein [Dinoroseobacter shibae]
MATPALDPARAAALALLAGVLSERMSLADQTAHPKGPFAECAPAERARAQRLATGVLRHLRTCDQMLGPHLRMPPYPAIHNILRLGAYELCALGEAPHGVVHAAVDLARAEDPQSRAPGLVNAVLRKVADLGPALWAAAPPAQLPKPFRKGLVKVWGNKTVIGFEAAHGAGAPLDLTLRDPSEAALWADRLGAVVLPTGGLRLSDAGQVSQLPGYAEGAWWVQDAAASLPARALGPVVGARVLDLCAAPGGKTLQLAAAGAQVTALDISDARVARLRENLARTGLAAEVVIADGLTYAAETPFDAILLDAPCSATGTIRRHPDLPFLRDLSDLSDLTALQAGLLDRAVGLLRPGGRLVFATCSLLPAEGEDQVAAALARHPGLAQVPLSDLAGSAAEWLTDTGALRLRPDFWAERGGLDGFFIAALAKPGYARFGHDSGSGTS